jgi:hypothetical protein
MVTSSLCGDGSNMNNIHNLVDVWFDVAQLQHIHKALSCYYKHADHPEQLLPIIQHVEHLLAHYETNITK